MFLVTNIKRKAYYKLTLFWIGKWKFNYIREDSNMLILLSTFVDLTFYENYIVILNWKSHLPFLHRLKFNFCIFNFLSLISLILFFNSLCVKKRFDKETSKKFL